MDPVRLAGRRYTTLSSLTPIRSILSREKICKENYVCISVHVITNVQESIMGDRGNIVLLQHSKYGQEADGALWMYTHWDGSQLEKILARILDSSQARDRWNDEPYLGRIIFEQLTEKSRGASTGYGITNYPTDGIETSWLVNSENLDVGKFSGINSDDGLPTAEEWENFEDFISRNKK
jgi:hypothetical protein